MFVSALLACASVAHAQTGSGSRWLVIPSVVGADDPQAVLEAAEDVREDLAARGHDVWTDNRAADRFEAVGSAPAPQISQSDIDRWVERSRAAVRYLARADYKAARRELRAAQSVADRAAAELNREAARAQQVLDTCLFMVRAYVETRNNAEARRQARECRQLVPRVEPTAFRHTPEVRDLLAEVDREMAAEAPGSLSITSAPADCLARVNGVEFGRTPVRDIELPVGTYRLQVECDEQRGRIHRVVVESGSNHAMIGVELDRVVRTRPTLHLAYTKEEDWASLRMRDGVKVADALDSSRVLVVSAPTSDTLRVDLRGTDLEPASVWIPAPAGNPTPDAVSRGLDALLAGRSVDFVGGHPTAKPSWIVEGASTVLASATSPNARVDASIDDGRTTGARPREQRIAGATLLALGVAAVGVGVGMHVRRGNLGDRFIDSPSSLDDAQAWQDARIPLWTLAAVGGASATAAVPLLLPDRSRTPWWGWLLGAGGAGLAAYGIYQGATMTGCPDPFITNEDAVRACVDRGQEAGRVALSVAGAAPLLSVPLVYLFRPLRTTPHLSIDATGAVLSFRRAF